MVFLLKFLRFAFLQGFLDVGTPCRWQPLLCFFLVLIWTLFVGYISVAGLGIVLLVPERNITKIHRDGWP